MRVCAPVVGSEQITAMFQNHLHDDKSLHYGEFINDLTKYLVRSTRSNISVSERLIVKHRLFSWWAYWQEMTNKYRHNF